MEGSIQNCMRTAQTNRDVLRFMQRPRNLSSHNERHFPGLLGRRLAGHLHGQHLALLGYKRRPPTTYPASGEETNTA